MTFKAEFYWLWGVLSSENTIKLSHFSHGFVDYLGENRTKDKTGHHYEISWKWEVIKSDFCKWPNGLF